MRNPTVLVSVAAAITFASVDAHALPECPANPDNTQTTSISASCQLNANRTTKGFVLAADDVEIDCQGYTLTPPSGYLDTGIGIGLATRDFLTIRECKITRYNIGIGSTSSYAVDIVDSDVDDNVDDGIQLDGAGQVFVDGGYVRNNGEDGLDADDSYSITIAYASISGNGWNSVGNGDGVATENSDDVAIASNSFNQNHHHHTNTYNGYDISVQYNTASNSSCCSYFHNPGGGPSQTIANNTCSTGGSCDD